MYAIYEVIGQIRRKPRSGNGNGSQHIVPSWTIFVPSIKTDQSNRHGAMEWTRQKLE